MSCLLSGAPPDALIQRACGSTGDGLKRADRILIFLPSKTSEKIYDPYSTGLLTRSFEKFKTSPPDLTESNLISIVEEVYTGRDIEQSEIFVDAADNTLNSGYPNGNL